MKPFLIRATACVGLAISLSGCFYSERVVPAETSAPPRTVYVAPPAPPSGVVVVKPVY
jgi:hypothetical protein